MASTRPQVLQSLTREQFWQQHIRQWQASGLSKMQYCRENELVYHQLIYWSDKTRQPESTPTETESNFVSVSLAPAQTNSTSSLSVELPNGITVAGVSAETISLVPQLLRML